MNKPYFCFLFLDVVKKMKGRRSTKTSDTEEAMDIGEDRAPVTLSNERYLSQLVQITVTPTIRVMTMIIIMVMIR